VAEALAIEDERAGSVLDGEPGHLDRTAAEALSEHITQVFAADHSLLRSVERNPFGSPCGIPIQNLDATKPLADACARPC
jgi:hypothetical protein